LYALSNNAPIIHGRCRYQIDVFSVENRPKYNGSDKNAYEWDDLSFLIPGLGCLCEKHAF
jgi:hypothetical protein